MGADLGADENMNLARINEGDMVQINIRGRVFDAVVVKKEPGIVRFVPTHKNITHFHARSNQVKKLIRRAKERPTTEG